MYVKNYDDEYREFRYKEYLTDEEVATLFDLAVRLGWKPHSWHYCSRLNLGNEIEEFSDDDVAKEFDSNVIDSIQKSLKYLSEYFNGE